MKKESAMAAALSPGKMGTLTAGGDRDDGRQSGNWESDSGGLGFRLEGSAGPGNGGGLESWIN